MSPFKTSWLVLVCLTRLTAAPVEHPLYFEARSGTLFETRSAGQVIAIRPDRIEVNGATLHFAGSSKRAHLEGIGKAAPSTYITREATTSFPQYPQARIRDLYPGVDVVFYGQPGRLEYDFDVAPGAKYKRIRLQMAGARGMRLDRDGNLVVATSEGEFRQLAPRVYQTVGGVRHEVAARYVLLSDGQVGFELGKRDATHALTIDPVIVYAKYYGGSSLDSGGPVTTDGQGNVYVAGSTNSVDFPSTNATNSRLQPPLLVFSSGGQTVTSLAVGNEVSVTAIGGTADGNVLYVATPNGVYYSGNHGASFVRTTAISKPVTVTAISVDAIDPSRAFLATNKGLFVMNANGQIGGENDLGLASLGNGTVNALSVQISPLDHLIAYATTAYPGYLYKTTNAGGTWQQLNAAYPGENPPYQPSGNFIAFTLAPNGSDLYVVDGNAVLLKSTDGGSTWQQLAGHLFNAQSITFDPGNPSNIYVVANYSLQKSTDGGATFQRVSPTLPGGENVISFAIDGGGALYIATNSGHFEVSADGGTTWQALPRRPDPHMLVGLGGQVFAGVDSPSVPFITKWSPDGSQLLYSTFFGGSFGDGITAIAVDQQGEAIVAGNAVSADFPATQTISPASPPGVSTAFVAKFSADGSQAIYSTILGGSHGVGVRSLAIDSTGAPYITGGTSSPDFPTTANALQPSPPAAQCQRPNFGPLSPIGNLNINGFVAKLTADGSQLAYSTFLTAPCGSVGQGIAVDASGEAVVVGFTPSPDFPVSANAYQSTFPGGPAADTNYPHPINFGFVTKLSPAGDKMVASSFIGGGFYTQANALALDSAGNAYITGSTWGITPGATPGAYQSKITWTCVVISIGPPVPPQGGSDAFLLKLDPAFTTAQYMTYLGGTCDDSATSIVLQPSGNVWIAGYPSFQDFPLVAPFQLGGTGGGFVSELSADASKLLFSTMSNGINLAADPSGAIYASGYGLDPSGPSKNGTRISDAFLEKIDPTKAPPVIISSVGISTTYQRTPNAFAPAPYIIAPGELISITGQHLGPSTTVMAQLDSTGRLPFQVSNVTVSFNGYLAPIISVQDGLIVCFAPFEIAGTTNELTVTFDGQKSIPVRVAVAPVQAYILTISNPDGTPNSADHPAPVGSVIGFYVSGLGLTSPLSQDGSVSAPPLSVPAIPVSAYVNGNPSPVQFAAAADGLVAGITQVHVQIPVAKYPTNVISIGISNALARVYISQ